MVGGPEIARIIKQFEKDISDEINLSGKDHDQTPCVKKLFVENVRSMVDVLNNMGNPYTYESGDLYVLDTKMVLYKSVAESLSRVCDTGLTQYNEYVRC